MRRTLLAAFALCCLASSAHATQGMNLRWDACMADGGVRNKTFACDTNTGSEKLVVSFRLASDLIGVNGMELSIDVMTPNTQPSSWWTLRGTGQCRNGALTVVAGPSGAPVGCETMWWNTPPSGGITAYNIPNGANFYRLSVLYAVPSTELVDFGADVECLVTTLAISHSKTVGAGSCVGCLDPVCIGLKQVKLTRMPGVGDVNLSSETQLNSTTVNWQGASAGSWLYEDPLFPDTRPRFRVVTCDAAVPARNHTWGSIKSQYH